MKGQKLDRPLTDQEQFTVWCMLQDAIARMKAVLPYVPDGGDHWQRTAKGDVARFVKEWDDASAKRKAQREAGPARAGDPK